ncbi:MAG: 60S ribosomal protein L11 [Marteilia pararefringens]
MAGVADQEKKAAATNAMREIKIDKVCLNICTGDSSDKVFKASKVLQMIGGGKEPLFYKAKLTYRNFGIRRGDKIASGITLRGAKAMDVLARGLKVKEFSLPKSAFSDHGNFGFGISEHIDMGYKYDTNIGIVGMDIGVVLSRRGQRVTKRKHCRSRVGKSHKITKEEAQNFFETQLSGVLI